jgi:hypothetical protein
MLFRVVFNRIFYLPYIKTKLFIFFKSDFHAAILFKSAITFFRLFGSGVFTSKIPVLCIYKQKILLYSIYKVMNFIKPEELFSFQFFDPP